MESNPTVDKNFSFRNSHLLSASCGSSRRLQMNSDVTYTSPITCLGDLRNDCNNFVVD